MSTAPNKLATLLRFLSVSTFALLLSFPAHADGNADTKVPEKTARIPMWLLFTQFTVDKAAMSPDGKYLAYTLREGDTVSVVVLDIDNPSTAKAKVAVINDEAASLHLDAQAGEKTPGAVTWMRWANNERLVVQTNARSPVSDGLAWREAPPGAIMAFNFDGTDAKVLVTARDISDHAEEVTHFDLEDRPDIEPVKVTKTLQPRAPQIVDLIPGNPNEILIRETPSADSNSLISFATFRLNVTTGKLALVNRYFLTNGFSTLIDSKGVPRINIPLSVLKPFPHKFRFLYGGFFAKEKELDVLANGKPAFLISPENFSRKRSVPLALDEKNGVLYIASNMERDTYGIYGLDLKTGKRTGFTFENGIYDLYQPGEGFFPDHYVNVATDHMAEIATEVRDKFVDGGPVTPESSGRVISAQVMGPNYERDVLIHDRHDGKIVGVRYQGKNRTASWVLPELNAVQTQLSGMMQGASIDILDWNAQRTRFLIRAESPLDPGSYFIYDTEVGKMTEFVRACPEIPRESLNLSGEFSFKHANGESVHGLVTLPRYVRRKPVPLVIIAPRLPWQRALPRYSADAQAFAMMGFTVAEISSRNAWGLGAKARESAATAFEQNLAEDMKLVADGLCKRFNLDRHRVALYGEGLGGFGALWALQLFPDAFRTAVVVNPTVDPVIDAKDAYRKSDSARAALELGYLGGAARMESRNLIKNVDHVIRPVGFLVYRGLDGEPRLQTHIDAESVFVRIKARAPDSEFQDLDRDFVQGLPIAKSKAFHEIEGFLNATLYTYDSKTGETKVIEEMPAKNEKDKDKP